MLTRRPLIIPRKHAEQAPGCAPAFKAKAFEPEGAMRSSSAIARSISCVSVRLGETPIVQLGS
jgi:hypothetical protein